MLVDECNKLYGDQPGDDATACVVRISKQRADEHPVRPSVATAMTATG